MNININNNLYEYVKQLNIDYYNIKNNNTNEVINIKIDKIKLFLKSILSFDKTKSFEKRREIILLCFKNIHRLKLLLFNEKYKTILYFIENTLDVIINYLNDDLGIELIIFFLNYKQLENKIFLIINNYIKITKNNIINYYKFIELINYDIIQYHHLDCLIFNILSFLINNYINCKDDYNLLIILNHFMQFDKLYFKFLPITSKLKYLNFNVNNSYILNSNDNFTKYRLKIHSNCIDKIFKESIIPKDIINENKLHYTKQEFIYLMLCNCINIFPTTRYKLPIIKKWNTILFSNSYKLYTNNNISNILIENNITSLIEYNNNIEKYFKINEIQNFKDYNYGIQCGELSRLIVIDIDIKDNGLEYWNNVILKELKQYNVEDNDFKTLKIKTGSGGYHYYFKYNENFKHINSYNKIFTYKRKTPIGIDFRCNNGYVIGVGSIHENGNLYIPINYDKNKTLDEQITDIPNWLMDKILNYLHKYRNLQKILNNNDTCISKHKSKIKSNINNITLSENENITLSENENKSIKDINNIEYNIGNYNFIIYDEETYKFIYDKSIRNNIDYQNRTYYEIIFIDDNSIERKITGYSNTFMDIFKKRNILQLYNFIIFSNNFYFYTNFNKKYNVIINYNQKKYNIELYLNTDYLINQKKIKNFKHKKIFNIKFLNF
jgi:hypothetical protein